MLLSRPYVFDIIVSDFGRESTIELVRSMAILEKRVIRSFLGSPDAPFLDEYRRLMFVVLGDLAYFKTTQIAAYAESGTLDRDVLVGMSDVAIPADIVERLENSVIHQLHYAAQRGYQHVRVVIPCNTLAPAGTSLERLFADKAVLAARIREQLGWTEDRASVLAAISPERLEILTIPSVVVDEVLERFGTSADLLVLGTPSTVTLYRREVALRGDLADYSVREVSPSEQEIINDAVVASIDGDSSVVRQLRQRIESEVVASHRTRSPHLVVIEACTDFDLGVGISSRNVFMARLVCDAYGIPMMGAGALP